MALSKWPSGILLLAISVTRAIEAQQTIRVTSARWFESSSSVDVTARVAAVCDGLTSCQRAVNDLGFPQPSSNRVIKNLSVTYSCGNESITIASREYLVFRLSCPSRPQPTHLIDFRINESPSCDSKEGQPTLALPAEYTICWWYEFDFSQAGDSGADVTDVPNGIKIDWRVRPGGFPCPMFGRGWMEKIFMVAGARSGEGCPPHP